MVDSNNETIKKKKIVVKKKGMTDDSVDNSIVDTDIDELNKRVCRDKKFIASTRPRRFGKTVMTNLISSYYAKGLPSKEIFDTLKISGNEHYEKHLISKPNHTRVSWYGGRADLFGIYRRFGCINSHNGIRTQSNDSCCMVNAIFER